MVEISRLILHTVFLDFSGNWSSFGPIDLSAEGERGHQRPVHHIAPPTSPVIQLLALNGNILNFVSLPIACFL